MAKLPSNNYKELRAIWYKKLEEEGFEDIEQDDYNLKVWSSKFSSKKSVSSWQAKATYYYMADKFLLEYKFATKLEQAIWEYHANAISVRDIAKILNKTKVVKTNRTTVWQIIKRLEEKMKKMYINLYNEYGVE